MIASYSASLLEAGKFKCMVCYGPYPNQGPTRITFRKKEKDFRVLGKSVLRRNGFVWSCHLHFIFIYDGGNQVSTKTPNDSSQKEMAYET